MLLSLPMPAMGGNDDDAELTSTVNPTASERTATIIFTAVQGGTGTATQLHSNSLHKRQ